MGGLPRHEARSVISRLDAVLSEANTRSADNTVPPKTMVISKENPPTDQLNFPPANTQMPATAGQNVRHKDTPKSDSKKEEVIDPDSLWNNMKTIPDF